MGDRQKIYIPLPLVMVACGFIGGITAGRFAPLVWGFWAVVGVVSLVGCVITFKSEHLHKLTTALLLLGVFCFGGAYSCWVYKTIPENHIVTFCPQQPMFATVRGKIVSGVQIRRDADIPGYQRPKRTHFLLEASHIQTNAGWREVSGLVSATIYEPAVQLKPGQSVELIGTIARYRKRQNPGQADWTDIANRTRVFVRMTMKLSDCAMVLPDGEGSAIAKIFRNVRASARQHLLACDDLYEGHLINALILGERNPALSELNRTMSKAGIAHFMSISGLHLGIFLWFVYLVCRLFLFSPSKSAWMVLVMIGLYVLLAEPRPALLRSAIMAGALCVSVISARRYSSLNALAFAAIILAGMDPMQVFDPGFQMSFIIVAGTIILRPELHNLLFGRYLKMRGLKVLRNQQTFYNQVSNTGINLVLSTTPIALAAWVVAVPIVAYRFSHFSPYAPILSLIVFPFVVMVLVPGYLSMFLMGWLPGLAGLAQRFAVYMARGLEQVVSLFESLPGLSIELYPTSPTWVLVCYAVIFVTVFYRRLQWGKPIAIGGWIVLAGLTIHTQQPANAPAGLEVNFLAVSSGQCAVVRTPEGNSFIVDAGTQSRWDAYREVLKPFLQTQKIPEPDTVFVSHDNIDHYNILCDLPESSNIKNLFVTSYFAEIYDSGSSPARLLRFFEQPDYKVNYISAGHQIQLDGSTKVEVLWPFENLNEKQTNENSLVLKFICHGRSILFCGDIEQDQQEILVETQADLKSDVLVLPHHGAWNKFLPEFVKAVSPKSIITSAGRNRTYTYANDNTNNKRSKFFRSLNQKYRYHCTASDGWIRINLGKFAPITIDTMRQND